MSQSTASGAHPVPATASADADGIQLTTLSARDANGNGNGHAHAINIGNGNGNGNGNAYGDTKHDANANADADADADADDDDDANVDAAAKHAADAKAAAAAAAAATASALTAADRAAVDRALDPNDADPAFAANMSAWSDAQVSYYLDHATAHTTAVLNAKAARHIPGDVEAEPPVTLTWRDVSYTKSGEKEPRLVGVTGMLRPQQMVCILGAPDAGITSFLTVLAGRNIGGTVTGDIQLNGAAPDPSYWRRVGFVSKDDQHLSIQTVQEALEFSARLRLPNVVPDRVKRIRALTVMTLLGLRHAANTQVGSETVRGVSGGEKRRLSIGIEWVAGHQTMLCDLPTNGLDSASAFDLMASYRHIARASNRSMMCSLVQPSPDLLDLFDTLMIMSHGRCVYYGPRAAVMPYFNALGYRMPPPAAAKPKVKAAGAAPDGKHDDSDSDDDDDGALADAAKSEPDYLSELSVQPHRFYHGAAAATVAAGITVVIAAPADAIARASVARPNPYSGRLLQSDVALDAVADPDPNVNLAVGAPGGLNAVRVHVPSDNGLIAPLPALSGGAPAVTTASPASVAVELPVISGGEAKQHDGGVPAAAKKLATLKKQSSHRVRMSQVEGVEHLIRSWADSDLSKTLAQSMAQAVRDVSSSGRKPDPLTAAAPYNTSFGHHLKLTVARQFTLVFRDPATSMAIFMQNIIIALLVGSLFWQIGTTQRDMRTRFGMFFFVLMFLTMDSLSSIPSLMDQRLTFYSQTHAGWYRGAAFYVAYIVANLPVAVIAIFVYLLIQYPMSGLTGGIGSEHFAYLFVLCVIMSQCSRAWCLFIAALSPRQALGLAFTSVTFILFSMFAGFTVPRDSIPDGWIWVYYISFFTWAIRGACQNELVPLKFSCADEEYLRISDFAPPVCPIPDGMAALAQYDMDPKLRSDGTPDTDEKWVAVRDLMWFLIAFNVAACLALVYVRWFHNDTSSVTFLSERAEAEEDDEQAIKMTHGVDASGKPVTPRTRKSGHGKSKHTPRSKRTAAAGQHVITVAQADAAAADYGKVHEMKTQPMTLSFANLTYAIDVPVVKPKGKKAKHNANANANANAEQQNKQPNCKTQRKELLIKTFGFVKPGTLVALMGPSGAGKTTLLDVLANKKNGGYTRGSFLINGKPRGEDFQRISGYVEQFDSHNAFSTVREAIEFSARLRLPADMSEADKMERVEAVLDRLSLRPYASQQIGTVEAGGVSPEIRKKVTIAVELVMNPSILFLDEPTTGLDSMAAMAVMEAVRKLAATISVVCTVHQPSAEIVAQFDTMLLMQRGGRVAYHGPINALSDYLESVGLGRCPEGRNIADHALEVAGGGISSAKKGGGVAKDPAALFAASPQCAAVQRELGVLGHNVNATDAQIADIPLGDGVERGVFELDTNSTLWTQYVELTRRFVVSIYRDGPTFKGRMTNAVIIAFVLSTLYFRLGFGQADATNRVSLFYLTGLFPVFSADEIIPLVVAARPMYFRERQAKTYSPFAYFMARLTGQLPYIAIESGIYCIVMYFVANLTLSDGGAHFWLFLATYVVMRMIGFSFAELSASSAESTEAGTGVQAMSLMLFMLFSGFLVPKSRIPEGWQWMHYLSLFKYPVSLLAQNELRDLSFHCDNNKGAIGPLELFNRSATADALTVACTTPTDALTDPNCFGYICPITSGAQMLESFEMDDGSMGLFFAVIVIMYAGYQAISYLILKTVQHIKR